MQFTTLLAAALLAAAPVLASDLTFFTGAGCTGSVISSAHNVGTEVCVSVPNGGSAKSISYSGVPDGILFFNSGGDSDNCNNQASQVFAGGSGCATAAAGVNFQSTFVF
ncbi:hypothetical protein C8R46DRAFT_1226618 [Mycena filopes]|nr:hypothetical protein C8R46DRAFT_1226618 [Mycena filopes]